MRSRKAVPRFSEGILLAGLLLNAPELSAGFHQWTSNGPEGGYRVTTIAIDPIDSATVYVVADDFPWGGVLFKMTNGGATRRVGEGLPRYGAASLVIDPSNPSILYSTTPDGIFKSIDGGENWARAGAGLPDISSAPTTDSGALAIDATRPSTLYWVMPSRHQDGSASGVIYKTTDGAMSWGRAGSVPGYPGAIAVDPKSPLTIYTSTRSSSFVKSSGGIFKSIDGAASWVAASQGLPFLDVLALAIDAHSSPSRLYIGAIVGPAGIAGGVFRSDDGAASWSRADAGLPVSRGIYTVVADPTHASTVYASVPEGVFKSMDGALSWSATALPGSAILAIDPQAGSTIYASFGGLSKSTDGGMSAVPIPVGLTRTNITALAVDPSAPSTIYAGVRSGPNKLRKSTDGGKSWRTASIDLDEDEILSLAVDPSQPSNVYALTYDGVFKSADGAMSWSAPGAGLEGYPNTLAIDWQQPSTLYVGTSQGVFQSRDGARSWRAINAGITNSSVTAIAISPADSATLYAGTQALTYYGCCRGTVFKSTDGGVTWGLASLGFPEVGVRALVIDLKNPSTVYAATTGDGVLKTTDGGKTWREMNAGLSNLYLSALVLDPSSPSTLYTGAYLPIFLAARSPGLQDSRPIFRAPLFRSVDGGESWTPFNDGLDDEEVTALAIDPTGKRLHAGTPFSGVFDFVFATGPSRPPTHVLPPR